MTLIVLNPFQKHFKSKAMSHVPKAKKGKR